jgi:hypothetical protein
LKGGFDPRVENGRLPLLAINRTIFLRGQSLGSQKRNRPDWPLFFVWQQRKLFEREDYVFYFKQPMKLIGRFL